MLAAPSTIALDTRYDIGAGVRLGPEQELGLVIAAADSSTGPVALGLVYSRMVSTPATAEVEAPLFKAAYLKQIPLDRYGTPADIAGVVAFLLSDAAAFLTGQDLVVDGGQLACQDNGRYMEIPGLRGGGA